MLSLLWFFLIATVPAADTVDFARDVRPILQAHCYECHSARKQSSGLRLDNNQFAFAGGELYGAAIVPGSPRESVLFQFVADDAADLTMPPDGDPLTHAQVQILKSWIAEGADWPDAANDAEFEDRADHWSFRPVENPTLPETMQNSWPRNPVDQFILHRLEAAGLQPAEPAQPAAWLRRVTLDLTGLPPTREDLDRFLGDAQPGARARVVDRLLSTPHYGERWAQHWLDVVRYADTHGFEVNTERPHAWHYRDYVIDAFNNGIPFSQFIQEQIIGDQLQADAGTGFLITASVLLPGQIGKDEPSKRLARQDAIDEIVVNIGQSFLGLSIGCARCHDHKFDAISQRDYYAMQAFVAGVEYADRQVEDPSAAREATRLRQQLQPLEQSLTELIPRAGQAGQRAAVNARENVDRFTPVTATALRFTILDTNRLEPCIDELEIYDTDGMNVALSDAGTTAVASGSRTQPGRHELRFVNDGRYGNSSSWMSSEVGGGQVTLQFPMPHVIERISWGRDRDGRFQDRLATRYRVECRLESGAWEQVADSTDRAPRTESTAIEPFESLAQGVKHREVLDRLLQQRRQLKGQLADVATGRRTMFAGSFRTPDPIQLLRRGDPEQPVEPVAPAVPTALSDVSLDFEASDVQRRTQLAHWIADRHNPLTARVMVNRIWQARFGTGLVDTPNDFGRNGSRPTHPQLLDWLATEFMASGWSVRHIDRLLALSATYGQSTAVDPRARAIDADVRLLWRYPTRRLDGESIRDSILSVSGSLNTDRGGPGFNLFDKRGGLSGFEPVESFPKEGLRRMIYAHRVRRERDAVFGAFDCPDGGQSTPRRRESVTAIQALNLLNSRFIIDQSAAWAARIQSAAEDSLTAQVQRAYRDIYCRPPEPRETQLAVTYVREHGLQGLCRALFNSNEFLFLP